MSNKTIINNLNNDSVLNNYKITKFYDKIYIVNNSILTLQNNLNKLIDQISNLRLDILINNLRNDISNHIYLQIPNINILNNANNNIIKLVNNSDKSILNYNKLALHNDFSLKFKNIDKIFRINYNSNKINNIIFYIYGVYDETIDIIESNINNVSKMVNIYTSDPLIDKTFDLVNLIIKEDKNYALIIIDGRE